MHDDSIHPSAPIPANRWTNVYTKAILHQDLQAEANNYIRIRLVELYCLGTRKKQRQDSNRAELSP